MINEDFAFRVGDRISLANVCLSRRASYESILSLVYSNRSQVRVIKEGLASHAPFVLEKQCKELCQATRNELSVAVDMSGYVGEYDVDCYLMQIISEKSKRDARIQDVKVFIVLTTDLNLLCVNVLDKGFLMKSKFPGEKSFIRLHNLQFQSCTRIDRRDLTFETFDCAINLPSDDSSENFFLYDTFKFTQNSMVKLSTAQANDNTRTLKLLVKEAAIMK